MTAAAVPCLAQQIGAVEFIYDANGNRTARTLSFQKTRGSYDSQEGLPAELCAPIQATSIEVLTGFALTLYPNPTEGHFSVGVSNIVEGARLQATLYTPAGTVISRKSLSGNSIDFDLSGYATGLYLLRFEAGNEVLVWTIIKY
ncbi:MAG: T9SS type A sorting domain-containing protein [Bacteroidales bacterium]|nr:T9SS type A sorting domain-containing protein [Bacteroidales bacterium]